MPALKRTSSTADRNQAAAHVRAYFAALPPDRRRELRKVRATFNTTTGAKDGTMTGDRGRYNTQQQILEGFGHVVITTNDGKRLTSPHVRYTQSINEVSSDSAFTMVEADGKQISGVGFRADPQLHNVTVLKGARGRGSFTLPGQ